jgi:hypothetical protein
MSDDRDVLERFRIHEWLGHYVDALNHRDWARYKKLWTEDAIFQQICESEDSPPADRVTTIVRPFNVRVEGRDNILGMVSRYNSYPWLVQMPHGPVAELESPTSAVLRHTLHVNSQSMVIIGLCYDRLRKEADGVWRLAFRDFRPAYFESREAKGLTTRKLPDPNYKNLPEK